jgi:hypothetical protein
VILQVNKLIEKPSFKGLLTHSRQDEPVSRQVLEKVVEVI